MSMTVADLIEWLKTKDQEAIVEVLIHSSGTGYYDQGGNISRTDLDVTKGETVDGGDHWEYVSFVGNKFVKPDASYYNKRYLRLGTENN